MWIFFRLVVFNFATSCIGSVKVKKSMIQLATELLKKQRIESRHCVVGSFWSSVYQKACSGRHCTKFSTVIAMHHAMHMEPRIVQPNFIARVGKTRQ